MNKLSFLWLAVALSGGVIGCGGETIAGGQNGANLNGAGSGGAAGGNGASCGVEQIGKACDLEGSSCKTGLRCEPTELFCKGGVWTADKSSCGEGGAAGAGGGSPAGAGGTTGGAAGSGGGGGKSCGGEVPPGVDNTCAKGEFCHYKFEDMCGAADATGVCTPIPPMPEGDGCPAPEFWVCGCDGNKYCNEAVANANGTSIVECPKPQCTDPNTPAQICVDGKVQDICLGPNDGAPESFVDCGGGTCVPNGQSCQGGKTCGGIAGIACAADEYCKFDSKDLCSVADQTGTCTKRPTECPAGCILETPLCDCNGNQYCNDCEVAKQGINVTDCSAAPVVCGGKIGKQCAADEFCNYDLKEMCGAFDSTGICTKKPKVCDLGCGVAPTCGCDGNDYCNECEANAKGVSVAEYSFCHPTPAKLCGGIAGVACAADEYCDFDGDTCGAGDQQGTCKPRPSCGVGCPAPEFWVCGCDGNKYCTACEANSKGVDVIPCAP